MVQFGGYLHFAVDNSPSISTIYAQSVLVVILGIQFRAAHGNVWVSKVARGDTFNVSHSIRLSHSMILIILTGLLVLSQIMSSALLLVL